MDRESSSRTVSPGGLRTCFILLILVIAISCCFIFSFVLALGYMHDSDPDRYYTYILKKLGLSGGLWYTLDAETEEKIISLGYDPMIVAYEIKANQWINSDGGEIDIGIQLSILEFESSGGTNIGNCSGLASALSFSQQQYNSAEWLLDYWKDEGIRDWSETARYALNSNYTDYIGHCSAGEIGPNAILPSTGVTICQNGLMGVSDTLVSSCNYFDYRVAPYAKVWWLKSIGYKASQSYEEKFQALYGWNRSEEFREKFLSRSMEINSSLAGWAVDPEAESNYVFSGGWWQKLAVKFLQVVNLLPEEVYAQIPNNPIIIDPPLVGEFSHPHPGSYLCGGYSYGQLVGNGIHWGIDLCTNGVSQPIYAMHSGVVTFAEYLPRTTYLAYHWWISGNVIAIEGEDERGNKIWTAYGHGSNNTMQVKVGQKVESGQFIMMSGTTGFSSGIHLHLGMKINNSWVNPANYIGLGGE
ncbi:M23 family metallopeptidase [Patescibacteria group bacterium]|nr:M23 family metallopeptidase [Patescibacteria group bacterium]